MSLSTMKNNSNFQASARTSVGSGQSSPTRQIMTKQSVPKPPTNVTLDSRYRNETCVRLSWSQPDVTNGIITGYKVIEDF